MVKAISFLGTAILLGFTQCGKAWPGKTNAAGDQPAAIQQQLTGKNMETITLGGGCFWCIEAVLLNLDGVQSATSGYMGGKIKNPTYREVCSGLTGHAEVVQVVYDTTRLKLADLLEVFFTVHDPTALNRQGNDVGTQYRSAIFYHTEAQKQEATDIVDRLNKSGAYSHPLVTEVSPAETFYKAEDYHQDYFNNNPGQGYCQYVIQPKLDKFRKVFPARQKKAGN